MSSILDNISGEDALHVLRNLCAVDEEMRARILSEVEKVFSQVDPDQVVGEVLFELAGLDVEELWDRSGPHRHGYSSPDEMAWEMAEEVLKPYADRIKQYQEMGMIDQSARYCQGVLQGIYQFAQESHSEFKEHAPDFPEECFGTILNDWRAWCTHEDTLQGMKEFISLTCPKWAKWANRDHID